MNYRGREVEARLAQQDLAKSVARQRSCEKGALVPNALCRDDTVHGEYYYRASEVDALLAERDRSRAEAQEGVNQDECVIFQNFSGLPRRKLDALVLAGWTFNGVSLERREDDGSVKRGAITTGGMVLWWNQPQAQTKKLEPLSKREFLEAVEGLEDLEDCWMALQHKLFEKNS